MKIIYRFVINIHIALDNLEQHFDYYLLFLFDIDTAVSTLIERADALLICIVYNIDLEYTSHFYIKSINIYFINNHQNIYMHALFKVDFKDYFALSFFD